jgi:predicted nucleic-acid-binding protein
MASREQVSASDIEALISSLINVKSSRVVCDKGVIEEIHVLTDSCRMPKQVVRDVESALMAQFGIELDHKKVSIAQTQNGKQFHFVDNRLKFYDVSLSLNGVRSEATVRLKKDDQPFAGSATGPGTGPNQLRLVATATLKAIEGTQGTDGLLMLEDINPAVHLAGRQAVVVCVSVITSRGDDYLVGSAFVKQDLSKAVVNAVLDAVNRRLGSLPHD